MFADKANGAKNRLPFRCWSEGWMCHFKLITGWPLEPTFRNAFTSEI